MPEIMVPDGYPPGFQIVGTPSAAVILQTGDLYYFKADNGAGWFPIEPQLIGEHSSKEMYVARMTPESLELPNDRWILRPPAHQFAKGDWRCQVRDMTLDTEWLPGPPKPDDPIYGETLAETQKRVPKLGIVGFATRMPMPTADIIFESAGSPWAVGWQRFILADDTAIWAPFPKHWPYTSKVDMPTTLTDAQVKAYLRS